MKPKGSPVKSACTILFVAAGLSAPISGMATGFATCESGAESTWQSQEKLTRMLTDKGWTVRRIKVDGGCYEAYVVNEKGERWEAYYHPQTLAPVASRQQTPR
ncbi:MAG: PepSY domain-containing protein [Betaproteobacteria bacterium]|nr:PepSY domain-containing protein [Betaproteobacteria bacterium]